MKSPPTTQAPQVDPSAPDALTAEQAAQVAGGLAISPVGGGDRYNCCNTCASIGPEKFATLAAALRA